MKDIGLVLEGGGMRGLYTAGVLDYFMEQGLYLPYVIGVSAGAGNAASYLSQQKGRSRRINIEYIRDPRYISYRNLLRERCLFGMDFIFHEIPHRIIPFDFDAFNSSDQRLLVGATHCGTGETVYFDKDECEDFLTVIRASSSLPFVSPMVQYQGMQLLDGGLTDPIPIEKSLKDGNSRNVVILTRNRGYRKKPGRSHWAAKMMYRRYPSVARAMALRYQVYNQTLDKVAELQKEKKAFVFYPTRPLEVDRVERDPGKLDALYQMGYEDAEDNFNRLEQWVAKEA